MFAKLVVVACVLALSSAENLGLTGLATANIINPSLLGHGASVYSSAYASPIGHYQSIAAPASAQSIITRTIGGPVHRPIISSIGHSLAQPIVPHSIVQPYAHPIINRPIISSIGHGLQLPIARTIAAPIAAPIARTIVGHGIYGSASSIISNPHGLNGLINHVGLY